MLDLQRAFVLWLWDCFKKLNCFMDPVLELKVVDENHFVFDCQLFLFDGAAQELIVSSFESLVENLVLGFTNYMRSGIDHRMVFKMIHES